MRRWSFALLCACVAAPLSIQAHHAYTEYQQDQTIEIEGILKQLEWRNPHVRFVVEVARPNAAPLVWDVESSGINNLNRIGAKLESFRTGTKVRVAGWPSKRGPGRMYVTNIMGQDGHELVLWRFSTPRWASAASGYGTGTDAALFSGGVGDGVSGLFRVWSSDYDDVDASPGALFRDARKLPWTEAARKVAASWDPARQGYTNGPVQGRGARYQERFTPSADGIRLRYTVTVTDEEVFTRPVEMQRSWVWRPNEKVMPFDCKT
jgi:hypothetical protein